MVESPFEDTYAFLRIGPMAFFFTRNSFFKEVNSPCSRNFIPESLFTPAYLETAADPYRYDKRGYGDYDEHRQELSLRLIF